MNLSKEETLIAYLAHLLEADKTKAKEEIAVLTAVAKRKNIEVDRALEVIANKDFAEFNFPKSEAERAEYLYTLVMMVQSDGKITTNEGDLIKKLGTTLGYRSDIISTILKKSQSENFQISIESFKQAITLHAN